MRSDTAMTGEISLRGLALPIGGVKEKVLAAIRAGITTVLLPARNRKDLEDVPEAARQHIRIVWLDKVEDALAAALEAPGLGDQILTQWVPVLGLVYEPKSNSVEIVVEGLDHMIRGPKAVYAEQAGGEVTSIEIIDKDDVRQILKFRDTLLLPAP